MRQVKLEVERGKPVCQWPECPFFATTEKAQGANASFKKLCPKHSAEFDVLGMGAADAMNWRRPEEVCTP